MQFLPLKMHKPSQIVPSGQAGAHGSYHCMWIANGKQIETNNIKFIDLKFETISMESFELFMYYLIIPV